MSSAVVSTSAASGRHFIFDDETQPDLGLTAPEGARMQALPRAQVIQSKISNQKSAIPLVPASRLEIRPAPDMVSSGIAELDVLTGGLPRGCLTEICGAASSGRTTLLLAALAAATARGEFCAVVDAGDALDPHSAAAAGVELERLLWVRCGEGSGSVSPQRHSDTEEARTRFPISGSSKTHTVILSKAKDPLLTRAGSGSGRRYYHPPAGSPVRSKNRIQSAKPEQRLEQTLRATDLLLDSGGFGLIVLELADLPAQAARRIPLTTWFRFRRAVEHTSTILLAIEQQAIAGSCSSLVLQVSSRLPVASFHHSAPIVEGKQQPPHTQLFTGLKISAEIMRSQLRSGRDRKPAHSVAFDTKTAWAG